MPEITEQQINAINFWRNERGHICLFNEPDESGMLEVELIRSGKAPLLVSLNPFGRSFAKSISYEAINID